MGFGVGTGLGSRVGFGEGASEGFGVGTGDGSCDGFGVGTPVGFDGSALRPAGPVTVRIITPFARTERRVDGCPASADDSTTIRL